jgi:ATP-dependent protease ClpP protease subunit
MPLNRLLLIAAFGLVGYMAWLQQQRIYANKGRLVISQSAIINGAVEFSWAHPIDVPMARRFSEGFDEWRDKTDTFVIKMNSPGGSLREGRKVIAVLENMKRTHKVITYVGPGGDCLSMCVPIFLHGQQRIAAASSRWMFHEPRSVDFFSDKEIREPESERQGMIERFVQRYFVNSPINESWRKQLLKSWKGKDIWRSGQQLMDENSNIITHLR